MIPRPVGAAGWLLVLLAAGCSARSIPVITPLVKPLVSPMSSSRTTLLHEPFNAIDPQRWHEIEVNGRSEFSIVDLDGQRVLKAHSQANASILICQVEFDPGDYPWINWRWRVDRPVEGEDLSTRPGSDAPARVYVYFDTRGLPWQKRSLDYVWSSNTPVGTIMPSAYSKTSLLVILESGESHMGTWQSVSRNMKDDYRAAFRTQGEVPDVLAIGLLSDADSTLTVSSAYYDDIMVTREPAFPRPAADGATAPPVP